MRHLGDKISQCKGNGGVCIYIYDTFFFTVHKRVSVLDRGIVRNVCCIKNIIDKYKCINTEGVISLIRTAQYRHQGNT